MSKKNSSKIKLSAGDTILFTTQNNVGYGMNGKPLIEVSPILEATIVSMSPNKKFIKVLTTSKEPEDIWYQLSKISLKDRIPCEELINDEDN